MGVPANKLRFIYVRARVGGPASSSQIAHMVLGYYETPNAVPLVLTARLDHPAGVATARPDAGLQLQRRWRLRRRQTRRTG